MTVIPKTMNDTSRGRRVYHVDFDTGGLRMPKTHTVLRYSQDRLSTWISSVRNVYAQSSTSIAPMKHAGSVFPPCLKHTGTLRKK